MRHRYDKIRLNRPRDQRKALVRNLLTSLFLYGKVQTTSAKAAVLSREAEKLITLVKRQKETFNAIRQLQRVLYTEDSSRKALDFVFQATRASGFVRATKIGYRPGDNAFIIQVELISEK